MATTKNGWTMTHDGTTGDYTLEKSITSNGNQTILVKCENKNMTGDLRVNVGVSVPTGITPTGTITLTQKTGTNVTNYASANVRDGSAKVNNSTITPTINQNGNKIVVSGNATSSGTVTTTGWIESITSGTATIKTTTYTIPSGTLNNEATSGITYTENTDPATVLPKNGALYINAGYYENTKITLGHLIPDPTTPYEDPGASDMRSGFVAFDSEGNEIIGTMAEVTPTFSGGVASLTDKTTSMTTTMATVSSGTYYVNIQGKAKATRTSVTYANNYTGYLDKASGTNASASNTSALDTVVNTTVYIQKASIGASGSGSANVQVAPGNVSIANNTTSVSGKTRLTATLSTLTTGINTYYMAVKANAAANTTGATGSISGSIEANVSQEGYAPSGLTGSGNISGTATATTSSKDSSVYYIAIPSATPSSEVSSLSSPTITISKSANGFTASESTTSYYVDVTASQTKGSVKSKYKNSNAGYAPANTSGTESGATEISATYSGTGKVYIPEGSAVPTVDSLSSPTVAISGSASGMATATNGTYYVEITGSGTNGSVKAKVTKTGGMIESGNTTSSESSIVPNITGSGSKVYIKGGSVTPEVNSLSSPTVAVSGTASGMVTATNGSYYVQVNATGTNGSVKAKETRVAGYVEAGNSTSNATTITPNITGSGSKVYIQAGALEAGISGNITFTPSVATNMATITKPSSGTEGTDYFSITGSGTKSGSVVGTANVATEGYVKSETASGGSASGTISSDAKKYIQKATITNNTSGGTSSGTINRGSQIKIAQGYNPSTVYYQAQANSGTLTISASGTTSCNGYASVSVPAGSEGTPVATKGTVSGNKVIITPQVTNGGGWIAGGTITGSTIQVTAAELVSGTLSITAAGTVSCTNYASVSVPSANPSFTGGVASITNPTSSMTTTMTTATTSDYYVNVSASAKATRTAVTYDGAVAGWVSKSSGASASAANTSELTSVINTTVYIQGASITSSSSSSGSDSGVEITPTTSIQYVNISEGYNEAKYVKVNASQEYDTTKNITTSTSAVYYINGKCVLTITRGGVPASIALKNTYFRVYTTSNPTTNVTQLTYQVPSEQLNDTTSLTPVKWDSLYLTASGSDAATITISYKYGTLYKCNTSQSTTTYTSQSSSTQNVNEWNRKEILYVNTYAKINSGTQNYYSQLHYPFMRITSASYSTESATYYTRATASVTFEYSYDGVTWETITQRSFLSGSSGATASASNTIKGYYFNFTGLY